MRVVVAKRTSYRGEGLGNELIPWAKGWIASQALHARLVGPSWGLNRRRYWRNFRSSRLDFILEDALLRAPLATFTEEDYLSTGEVDFGTALLRWVEKIDLVKERFFVVGVEGMWGGYGAIRNARWFLWERLLGSRDALDNMYRVLSRLDRSRLQVAVHIRSKGDGFSAPAQTKEQRGKFNLLVPGDWYLWVCRAVREAFGERVQFWFFSDRPNPVFEEGVERFNPSQIICTGRTECSDLLLMAQADLRLCSVSSYSLAAAFLSDGPYVWYEPQLALSDGTYSLWGHEATQQLESSSTARSRAFVRCLCAQYGRSKNLPVSFLGAAMDIGDPLPDQLLELLEQRLREKETRTNLLEYGCLPRFVPPFEATRSECELGPSVKRSAR